MWGIGFEREITQRFFSSLRAIAELQNQHSLDSHPPENVFSPLFPPILSSFFLMLTFHMLCANYFMLSMPPHFLSLSQMEEKSSAGYQNANVLERKH